MTATIQHKRGSGTPVADDLAQGELALDLTNNAIFTKNTSDEVVRLSSTYEMVNVKDFGAKGDGSTDDAAAIQAAIDSADGAVFFPRGTYVINTPIYLTTRKVLFGEGDASTIKKVGTTAGTGNNLMSGVTDYYTVDAAIIVTHTDNAFAYYVGIHNLRIQGDDAYTTSYGIYAPRMSQSAFSNVRIYRCLTGFYTKDSWQVSFNRVTIQPEKMRDPLLTQKNTYAGTSIAAYGPTAFCRGFHWDWDGGSGGAGTSCTFTNCYVRQCDIGYDIQYLSYSAMVNCAADQINETAYKFTGCQSMSLTSCGAEDSMASPAMYFSAGKYNITSMNIAFKMYGSSGDPMYRVIDGARVSFYDARITDFVAVNGAYNRSISSNSDVLEVQCSMPTNGNDYSESYPKTAKQLVGAKQAFNEKKTVVTTGTNIANITVSGSGNRDYMAGKLRIFYEDIAYANGIGYVEVPFSVYRTSTQYFQNINIGQGTITGNGFSVQPTFSFTRSGNVWTIVMTPSTNSGTLSDLVCLSMEAELYTDPEGDATFAWL